MKHSVFLTVFFIFALLAASLAMAATADTLSGNGIVVNDTNVSLNDVLVATLPNSSGNGSTAGVTDLGIGAANTTNTTNDTGTAFGITVFGANALDVNTTNTTTNSSANTSTNLTDNATAPGNTTPGINTTNVTITNSTGNSTTNDSATNSTVNSTGNSTPVVIFPSGAPAPMTMLETDTGVFTILYDRPANITWYVDGTPQKTMVGTSDTFSWAPGILYVSTDYSKQANITAIADGQTSTTFIVDVTSVLNPYWQYVTGSTDTLHVISNNNVRSYSTVIVTLEDSNGLRNVTLTPLPQPPSETNWQLPLSSFTNGNTFIRTVIAEDNGTGNATGSYPVDGTLAHYKQGPVAPSGGGGGGGGIIPPGAEATPWATMTYTDLHPEALNISGTDPVFIYAVFNKDVINQNDSVMLSVDAKDNKGVVEASAVIVDENGARTTVPLKLTRGSKGYGTWSASLSGYPAGKNSLESVQLVNMLNHSITAPVGDRAFYVTGGQVGSNQFSDTDEFMLVYALLDKNVIDAGQAVSVRLDARDYRGIDNITATLKSDKDTIDVPLGRVSGNPQYGTWGGSVALNKTDTTYALTSVTINVGGETRVVRVYGQKTYVNYVAPAQQSMRAKANEGFSSIIQHPAIPLLIGFVGMAIAMLIISSMTFMRAGK